MQIRTLTSVLVNPYSREFMNLRVSAIVYDEEGEIVAEGLHI